jgi:hypothetical protein
MCLAKWCGFFYALGSHTKGECKVRKNIEVVAELPSADNIRKLTDGFGKLPETGFLRLWQIIGDKKRGIPPLIPVSKSGWWKGVSEGKYPVAVKLSERTTCWRVSDIRQLIETAGA